MPRRSKLRGVRLDDVDLFAVAAGPGSFTGLRVGIASIQGLAFARGLRVVPVPALDALARAGRHRDQPAGSVDGRPARPGLCRALRPDGEPAWLIAATCAAASDTVAAWAGVRPSVVRFVGDGASATPASSRRTDRGSTPRSSSRRPSRRLIARIAAASPHQGRAAACDRP
jgi:tRNA threonylcarbamoyl adenosine modification protein YeaZ